MEPYPVHTDGNRKTVVIAGGGLAGIAAACRLADDGHKVILLEKSQFLGGRAASFPDPVTGEEVDTGQHVFMKCCTAYIALLQRLGSLDKTRIQPRLRVEVHDPAAPPHRRTGILESVGLPVPLHLLPSFLRFPHLTRPEKLAAARAILRMRRVDRFHPSLHQQTFADWLRSCGQSRTAVQRFWDIIILPTLNASSEKVSADAGLMVFQEALLKDPHGADIGYAKVGLTPLLAEEVRAYLNRRGGEVRMGEGLATLITAGEGGGRDLQAVRLSSGTELQADAYVCALPHQTLLPLLPAAWRDNPFFSRAKGLQLTPIMDIHVWYDRVVTPPGFDFGTVLNNEAQWVFNKGTSSLGQHLGVTVSGADAYMSMPRRDLQERFLPTLSQVFPQAAAAQVRHFLVRKQRHATFLPSPGSDAYRLPQATPVPNLFLAGDWTISGWPATMEGAVRSGNLAADAVTTYLAGSPPGHKMTALSAPH